MSKKQKSDLLENLVDNLYLFNCKMITIHSTYMQYCNRILIFLIKINII